MWRLFKGATEVERKREVQKMALHSVMSAVSPGLQSLTYGSAYRRCKKQSCNDRCTGKCKHEAVNEVRRCGKCGNGRYLKNKDYEH